MPVPDGEKTSWKNFKDKINENFVIFNIPINFVRWKKNYLKVLKLKVRILKITKF